MQSVYKRCYDRYLAYVVIVGALLTTGCPTHETISRIKADPGRYANRDVTVAGRVTNAYGALGRGAFELDDGTGKIWVATQRGVPAKGSSVDVTGKVISGFSYGGTSLGIAIEESGRHTHAH